MNSEHYMYDKGTFTRVEKAGTRWKGVFETMRSYHGVIFGLEHHLKRLRGGCIFLGIKPPQVYRLKTDLENFLGQKRVKNARIRLTATAEKGRFYMRLAFSRISRQQRSVQGYRIMVINRPLRKRVSLNAIKSTRRDFYEHLYLWAQGAGYDEAVFLNTLGFVVEGTRTNIFLVKNGLVYTPALSDGCLPGITRSIVLELAAGGEVIVRQGHITAGDLYRADELFVTNAVIGIMPVLKVDGKTVGAGRPGKISLRFMRSYKILIEKECKRR